ncbi:hypothetical protein [Occallatibacter riparius]|uniref:Uncharacterized protein n=1 Tax=Occallatibacter riparius TaxID=1002689 RepID=A0A9J7BT84_9BACT|nr:hypothetical protein [Occallatibacter riparius]UWZ84221.1 hypothetical protein MOP44_27195 [Occallatibacter riparius]
MTEDAAKGLEPSKRPLTSDERDLVRWLVEHSESEIPDLLQQIERLTVFEKCTCGCPTVYFALDGEPVSSKGERIISDWLATVNGDLVGVMLFQTDGRLSSMEVYSCAGTDEPFGLPAIDSLFPYEDAPDRGFK